MKPRTFGTGICAIAVIALLLTAGCMFQPAGNAPAQPVPPQETITVPVSPTTEEVTQLPAPEPSESPDQAPPVQETAVEVTTAVSVLQSCGDIGGAVCFAYENCTGDFIKTTDEPRCCAGSCESTGQPAVTGEPTTPVLSPEVSQTCSDIGGNVCLANEECTGAFIRTTDEVHCCAGTCEGIGQSNTTG
jgi:hypothetical protein